MPSLRHYSGPCGYLVTIIEGSSVESINIQPEISDEHIDATGLVSLLEQIRRLQLTLRDMMINVLYWDDELVHALVSPFPQLV
jgi:hypothetical protein